MTNRTARVERITRETQILIELDLDGTGKVEVATGV
ncbi:MAG TPA: imidazoleglycerol-phosphate dehydratase, partial [Streptosporangiaceae bacterium]